MKFKDFNFYNKSIDKDLKEFSTLMEYAFPDENERDTFEKICHYLMKNKQQNNQYHVLIAYDNEKILGGSIFTYLNNSSSGVVEFIVVSPDIRQKGIGKAIYEEILNILKLNAPCFMFLLKLTNLNIGMKPTELIFISGLQMASRCWI